MFSKYQLKSIEQPHLYWDFKQICPAKSFVLVISFKLTDRITCGCWAYKRSDAFNYLREISQSVSSRAQQQLIWVFNRKQCLANLLVYTSLFH